MLSQIEIEKRIKQISDAIAEIQLQFPDGAPMPIWRLVEVGYLASAMSAYRAVLSGKDNITRLAGIG